MKNEQGSRWRRLDNTAKIFPVIANENLSNVFRLSVTLKEEVVPEILLQALEEVLPHAEGFNVRIRRGFFWYYFETNKRKPQIEKEASYPCKYIEPRRESMYLFRVSYYENRINLEVFHALTDGLGAVHFLRELTYRYLDRKRGKVIVVHEEPKPVRNLSDVEDSYLKNYKKGKKGKYSTVTAYHISGNHLPLDAVNVIHGYMDTDNLKQVSKAYGVSITKFLVAGLIFTVYDLYLKRQPCEKPIGINLPVNLRSFFESETTANFFAVTAIRFLSQGGEHTFEEILAMVSRQMDENISKEKFEETISYNVSNERHWYTRIAPLFLKWIVANMIFRRNDRAHTMTVSNIGPIGVEEEYEDAIERFHLLIGVCKRQNLKCSVCAFQKELVFTFSSVFTDTRLQDGFFGFLESRGIKVATESNGAARKEDDKGMYPQIHYDADKWKKVVNVFYAVLFAISAILGVVNYAVYNGFLWSVIAIACIAYTALTVRYSIMRHANLGSKIMIQTIGVQILLVVIDYMTGYRGWSVDYAVPATILFADASIVFLILVNRLNWQSYFMYQISLTVFSVIPMILWAVGLIRHPVMAVITFILSALVLILVVLLGDRSVKNELIRRFHL